MVGVSAKRLVGLRVSRETKLRLEQGLIWVLVRLKKRNAAYIN